MRNAVSRPSDVVVGTYSFAFLSNDPPGKARSETPASPMTKIRLPSSSVVKLFHSLLDCRHQWTSEHLV